MPRIANDRREKVADVVLVQPRVGDWDEIRSHPSIPLALLSAARLVAKEFSVVLIDTRINKDWKAELIRELKKSPLCVGVTSMTGRQIRFALEISKAVKKHSRIPVIWGGIHASILPDETLQNPNIDFLIKGEGEKTFQELVKNLKSKESRKNIPGLWYKEGGAVKGNHDRAFCSLDDLEGLPYHLVDLANYLPLFMGRRTMYIETSRGCPNACTYCYNKSYNNRRWRAQSPEGVLRHIKDIVLRKHVKSFYVVDDNTFVDLNRVRKICEGIVKDNLDIYWEAQGITIRSALKMDDAYISLLERSGLKKVHFGVESGSENVLSFVDKNISISDICAVNKKFKQHNIIVQYNFMSGLPTETTGDIKKTIKLIFDLMRENPKALISPMCPYTPYPGTELYRKALKDGFRQKSFLEDWVETDYGDSIWTSKKRTQLLKNIFFTSMFLDTHRAKDMIESQFFRHAINMYRPLAKFRLKHMFFSLMPEIAVKNFIFKN